MVGPRRGRDPSAKSGEGRVEGSVELIVGAQEDLDSTSQLGIARTLGVQ
jgi:hypothetical protein